MYVALLLENSVEVAFLFYVFPVIARVKLKTPGT